MLHKFNRGLQRFSTKNGLVQLSTKTGLVAAPVFPTGWEKWENGFKVSRKDVAPVATEYLSQILSSQVYEIAHRTPLTYGSMLSSTIGNEVYLKREDMQPVFSFKIRGAYNKIAKLSQEARARGVVACSAGNHAQGVAISAARLGIKATIIMPLATPDIKCKAVQRFGGSFVKVKLHGQNYDEAATEANRLVIEENLTMVHPFNDPDVIAGQGTIGVEILQEFNGKPLNAVFVCVGGGGLLAGVAAYIKSIRPDVLVIGVEAEDAAGMTASLLTGKVVTLPQVGLFADGAAVKTVGHETFRVCSQLVDAMVTVTNDEICAAIKHGFNDTRCVMEPAGALAIAGMIKYAKAQKWEGKNMVAIASGANMDFDRLRFVSERADSSEVLLSVAIPERPGSFRELYSLLYPRVVTEFSYRHDESNRANVIVSVQAKRGTPQDEDKAKLVESLSSNGYLVRDLSTNELAKTHVRHLAGGRTGGLKLSHAKKELLYRFEFPEAPGALNRFLSNVNLSSGGWDISLFHYRNHGSDFGRVLVGILVEEVDRSEVDRFLEKLGYVYYEETNNSSYLQFLK